MQGSLGQCHATVPWHSPCCVCDFYACSGHAWGKHKRSKNQNTLLVNFRKLASRCRRWSTQDEAGTSKGAMRLRHPFLHVHGWQPCPRAAAGEPTDSTATPRHICAAPLCGSFDVGNRTSPRFQPVVSTSAHSYSFEVTSWLLITKSTRRHVAMVPPKLATAPTPPIFPSPYKPCKVSVLQPAVLYTA